MRATGEQPEKKHELVRLLDDYVACWNAHDVERILDFVTEDVVLTDPLVPQPVHGRHALGDYLRELFRLMPDSFYRLARPVCTSPTTTGRPS